MISPKLAAGVFAAVIAVVMLFQLALALGAPLGEYAMGGAFPGVYPPAMRVAAVVQMLVLGGVGLMICVRAGLILPHWQAAARWPSWAIVALLGVGVMLNLITPSGMERLIWAPVAVLLFLSSLQVARAR